jgi:hypothetical protein
MGVSQGSAGKICVRESRLYCLRALESNSLSQPANAIISKSCWDYQFSTSLCLWQYSMFKDKCVLEIGL